MIVVLMTIFKLSVFLLYVVIANVSGYNIAYRVVHCRKLSMYETLLGFLTMPLSLIVFSLSYLGMIVFALKRTNDGWVRIK